MSDPCRKCGGDLLPRVVIQVDRAALVDVFGPGAAAVLVEPKGMEGFDETPWKFALCVRCLGLAPVASRSPEPPPPSRPRAGPPAAGEGDSVKRYHFYIQVTFKGEAPSGGERAAVEQRKQHDRRAPLVGIDAESPDEAFTKLERRMREVLGDPA